MSVTSRKRSKKTSKGKALDRPFTAAVLKRAKAIAQQYRIILEIEDGEYYGRGFEMPYVMADGKTAASCYKATYEALVAAVATMIENGDAPPAPSSDEKRSEQVNVRLTAMEKARLEEASRQQGFRGLSDYIRSKALN